MDIEEYKKSMPRCKDCTGFGWGECKTAGENEVACKDFERKPKLTNGDKIRAMTDEDLAEMVDMRVCRIVKPDGNNCPKGFYFGKCDKCVLAWLRKECEEDAGSKTD